MSEPERIMFLVLTLYILDMLPVPGIVANRFPSCIKNSLKIGFVAVKFEHKTRGKNFSANSFYLSQVSLFDSNQDEIIKNKVLLR